MGEKCRLLIYWDEVGEAKVIGLEIIQKMPNRLEEVRVGQTR